MVIKRIRETLDNKGNAVIVWFMISVALFVGLQPLVIDFGGMLSSQIKVKNSLNKAVKAASLAIQDGEDLANGNFRINSGQAEVNFNRYIALNLGLNEITLEPLSTGSRLPKAPTVKEFVVQNTASSTYTSSYMGQTYQINKPTVISSLEFSYQGVFLRKSFRVGRLSSSQLNSVYD